MHRAVPGPRCGGLGLFGTTNADVQVATGTPGRATARFCRFCSGGSAGCTIEVMVAISHVRICDCKRWMVGRGDSIKCRPGSLVLG